MTSESLTAPAPRNGRLLLYGGLIMGVIAAALVAYVLSTADDDGTATAQPATTRIAVAAARDIPARTRITADMLKVGVFKIEDVDSEAFGAVSQVVNRVSSADIAAGQVITPARVSETTGTGLTFKVSPGMRAISIGVNEVTATGGNVAPGDFVDLIAIFNLKDGADINGIVNGLLTGEPAPQPLIAGGRSILTITLLQNVRVLAVAQNAAPSAETTASGPAKVESNPKASTVTLEVTPEKAQILALAGKEATLRLSLRPFGEDVKQPLPALVTSVE